MKIEEVSTLKIHNMSQEKFNREEAAGNLNENEIYLTPAPEIDNEPIDGSNNLITSGGVAAALKNINITSNNTQSDWLETDVFNGGYIKNKPGDTIIENVNEILTDSIINKSSDTNLIPGLHTWGLDIKENVDYNNGEKVILKILPDNVILEANLYTDKNTDAAFGFNNDQIGHYAAFNLKSDDVLIAYSNGFMKQDENIPYGIGINILKKENPKDFTQPLLIVSAENNLENKHIILEVIKEKENYVKLSNNALNIDNEVIEGSNNLITSNAVYEALLDNVNKLPEIIDITGMSELDNAITSGVYKYIADNGLECILFISERVKNEQKNITQLLIKTTSNTNLSNDNLGRGLIGRGVFIRTGIAMNGGVLWENNGKFSNIHDLPQAPPAIGYYLLNSDKNENNEFLYTWTELSDGPMEGILNQVSTWLDNELKNIAHTNTTNIFTTSQVINGDLTVNGDIIQEGDSYITHAEHVYTEDDYIILRDGAQTSLSSYAGFEIQNYDGNNTTGHLVFDNQGTARVGDIGEEEPLTTRAEANEIIEGSIATWGVKNGAPVLTSGISIMILTQTEYDSIVKDNNTLYLIKEG